MLTIIDPATVWFKCEALRNALTANKIHQIFDNIWLARYPQPKEIVFDNGSEFKSEFRALIDNMGLKCKSITSSNPPLNTILEHVHQLFENKLQKFDLPNLDLRPEDTFEEFITASA